MKLASVTAVALLSGVSLAAPRFAEDVCGGDGIAQTITVTVTKETVINHATAGGAAGVTITVTAPAPVNPSPAPGAIIQNSDSGSGGNGGSGGDGGSGGSGGDGSNSRNGFSGSNESDGVNVAINNGAQAPPAPAPTPAAANAMVTAVEKGSDGGQTVRACPTGQTDYQCFQAIYGGDGKMMTINIIEITVTTINGQASTMTVTKDGNNAQITPGPTVNIVNNDDDDVVTQVIDETVTSTKNGKTVYATSTHTTVVKGTGFRGTGTGIATNTQPTHHVKVGANNKMEFDPPSIKANSNDVIRFNFFPRNHTVTSCSFESPCVSDGNFDSGFKYTLVQNSTEESTQTIDFPVQDASKALYFFS